MPVSILKLVIRGAALAALTTMLACSAEGEADVADVDAGSDGDSDADAGTDADSDVDADTSTIEDLKGPQHTPPLVNLYQEGIDGFVMVSAHTHPYGCNYTADAQFFVVYFEEPADDEEGLIGEDGVDSCSLSYLGGTGGGGDSAVSWLEAGTVEVASGPQHAVLETYDGGEVIPYTANLAACGEPRYGEDYSFYVSGDEAPVMEIAPAATLPTRIDPITPPAGDVLSHDGFTFTWEAGDDASLLYIELLVHETYPSWYEMYEVRCWVHDDGEFEVPGLTAGLLPDSWYVSARLSRVESVYHDLGDDQVILAVAHTLVTALYTME